MLKKILLIIAILFYLLFPLKQGLAFEASRQTVYFFYSAGCPHCIKEKVFLEKLLKKHPELQIQSYEISSNQENFQLLQQFGQELSVDVKGVPFTVVGQQYFSGYLDDQTTGAAIEAAVQSNQLEPATQPGSLKLPFFGRVSFKNLSLPLLTLVFGLIDGFNPCAMWVLLFLISLLLGIKNRRRMWLLGSVFIFASALVYFVFLAAWLNLFLFIGFMSWVRLLIGAVALGIGSYYLRDYYINRHDNCQVMGNSKRQQVFARIRMITQRRSLLFALLGIVFLAFAVNLVELVCSAGLPAVYTQILSLNHLPRWQYYLYLLFYVFIFMLDDLFVFFAAMLTLKAVGFQGKYSRFSRLIGGLVILIIGLLLLFRPGLLMLN